MSAHADDLHKLAQAVDLNGGGRESTSVHPLLSVRLSASYAGKPEALRGVHFEMSPGEILGLVGQSGSGKSTMALAILGLLRWKGGAATGEVLFQGRDLMQASERDMRRVRGHEIALVLQSPLSSLNPALRIRTQFREAWSAHSPDRGAWERAAVAAMESASLPDAEHLLERYPRELSVGLSQRVLIAMAILHRPALLIADEPTSALDVITQSEILDLFAALNRNLGMAILYISHDLLSVAALCHRVAILKEGELVETGCAERVFRNPAHPYARRLIAALPRNPFAALAASETYR